uniref:Uncharacterized protein n=1 Tax=Amphimedon queenslandica TaxID=400682 RepID=A0A1X7UET3_AMPQE
MDEGWLFLFLIVLIANGCIIYSPGILIPYMIVTIASILIFVSYYFPQAFDIVYDCICDLCIEENQFGRVYESALPYDSLGNAAEDAFSQRGTLLRTDDGRIYWSTPFKHAEQVFIRKTKYKDISHIKTIWIKNSPCCWCADQLIDHFDLVPNKPTVYIGKIWRGAYGDARANKEGLRKMERNGFKLLVWEDDKNKEAYETREYLRNIDI